MSNNHTIAIEKLKLQQAKITARIQQIEARSKVTERKQDMRRKILIGAYYLDQAKQNPDTLKSIKAGLASYLTRNTDRRLFELEDIAE